MVITIPAPPLNTADLLRRVGYTFQRHAEHEMSFVRPLAAAGFPRFHIYAQTKGIDLLLSIHLDEKKETYGEATRHHGAYDNEGPLAVEVERITREINTIRSQNNDFIGI